MTPKTNSLPAKPPRARVMHANSYDGINNLYVHTNAKTAYAGRVWSDEKEDPDAHNFPVAVLPCATAKQAKAVCKWANLSHEEKVKKVDSLITKSINRWLAGTGPDDCDKLPRAILALTGQSPSKEKK